MYGLIHDICLDHAQADAPPSTTTPVPPPAPILSLALEMGFRPGKGVVYHTAAHRQPITTPPAPDG
jgi:hypothetical protein